MSDFKVEVTHAVKILFKIVVIIVLSFLTLALFIFLADFVDYDGDLLDYLQYIVPIII